MVGVPQDKTAACQGASRQGQAAFLWSSPEFVKRFLGLDGLGRQLLLKSVKRAPNHGNISYTLRWQW